MRDHIRVRNKAPWIVRTARPNPLGCLSRAAPKWLGAWAFPRSRRASEIRLVRFRARHRIDVEDVLVVLVAMYFFERLLIAHPALSRGPLGGESAGVIDLERNLDRLAAIDELVAFDDMELVAVGCAVIVDEGLCRHANRVDDESVAVLIMADRVAVPGRLRIRGVLRVQPDAPDFGPTLVDHDDLVLLLEKEGRLDRGKDREARNADRPAQLARTEGHLSGQHFVIGLLHLLLGPRLKDRIAQIR